MPFKNATMTGQLNQLNHNYLTTYYLILLFYYWICIHIIQWCPSLQITQSRLPVLYNLNLYCGKWCTPDWFIISKLGQIFGKRSTCHSVGEHFSILVYLHSPNNPFSINSLLLGINSLMASSMSAQYKNILSLHNAHISQFIPKQ